MKWGISPLSSGVMPHYLSVEMPQQKMLLNANFCCFTDMPTEYKRKCLDRGKWSSQQLSDALEAINNGTMGVNEASRTFQIPSRTLRRRITSKKQPWVLLHCLAEKKKRRL
ncbi:hypothetical protein PPYR_00123 [Photinus pyralis]|uniref:HTH psq-type domain-containing protein n=1 Tax=Photinus pyralis TaxID=7054 RepID=A0A5N4B0S2_PHOPY|nr:hypothetical protein PPYR_00123 [Photinus pyralis]